MRIYPLLSKVVDNQNTDFKITIVNQKLLIHVAIICPIIGLTYIELTLDSVVKFFIAKIDDSPQSLNSIHQLGR